MGLWWFGWAPWTLRVVPEPKPPLPRVVGGLCPLRALSLGSVELGRTLREIRRFKVLVTYILAYLLFNDGIQTVPVIAGAFAADTIGIPLAFSMATILVIQFVAAGATWLLPVRQSGFPPRPLSPSLCWRVFSSSCRAWRSCRWRPRIVATLITR